MRPFASSGKMTVYAGGRDPQGRPRFQQAMAPDKAEPESLIYAMSERTGRYLECQGLSVRDLDNTCISRETQDEPGLEHVPGSSITCCIAIDPHQGHRAFSMQTLLPESGLQEPSARVASVPCFLLHAGVVADRHER